jgi:hypothetical protein
MRGSIRIKARILHVPRFDTVHSISASLQFGDISDRGKAGGTSPCRPLDLAQGHGWDAAVKLAEFNGMIVMHRRNKLFVTIGLAYGLLGGLLALVRLADPALLPGNLPRIHAHVMLLGFVLMTIYGVGLHVIPRFGGYPLRSERIATVQFWLANAGLPLMIAGWVVYADRLVMLGGVLTVAAMALFGVNMMLTVRLRSPLDSR